MRIINIRKKGGNAIFINKATKQTTIPHVITSQHDQAVTVNTFCNVMLGPEIGLFYYIH